MDRKQQYIENAARLLLLRRKKQLTRESYSAECLKLAKNYIDIIPRNIESVVKLAKIAMERSYDLDIKDGE